MAINFPDSPSVGDEFTGGGFTWTWNGSSWEKVAATTTSGTGFSLLVGLSGNTTYTFPTSQPAGSYSISSSLNDTTFDTYLITSTNENAGYASGTEPLEASAEFNRVVVYGATTNDVLNFEYKPSSAPSASGDVDDGAAPFLTSATPTTLESIDDTTIVTGGNFASDVEIVFTGQDAVDRAAKNIVRSTSTSLIVTRPDSFPVAQEPYTMTATNAGIPNPSTNVNKLTNYFDAGGVVTWVTSSLLPDYTSGTPYSTTLQATDADGGAVTYSIQSGSLPTGLTLNETTGQISGTPSDSGEKTVTITATDSGGNSSNRAFTLTDAVTVSYLVIAGGGGGGRSAGAGGGAGGYRTSFGTSGGNSAAESLLQVSGSFTVTVGAGGPGMTAGSNPPNGSDSVFSTITSSGGGSGGGHNENGNVSYVVGKDGGSGGGSWSAQTIGQGTPNQGFDGGQGTPGPGYGETAGGGGGAGSVGDNGVYGTSNGNGGDGLSSSITGTAIFRAAGGGAGAGSWNNLPNGIGGNGGGGNGGRSTSVNGTNATVNTGSGGGGGSYSGTFTTLGTAGNGASGVVILRYSSNKTATIGAGLIATTDSVSVPGYKITTFTSGTGTVSIA